MGYGAMRITGEGIWGPPKDKEESLAVLKKAVDLGVNLLTQRTVTTICSEELIAEALHPYPKGLVIATKGGLLRTGPNQWPVNAHPDHLQKALEGSLKRLKLEQIELYQLHRVDPNVPFEKTFEFLQRVQKQGLVKHIGLSEVGIEQIKQAQQYIKVVSVQNMYSVDNRKWENEMEYCRQQDIAFIPWYPLNAGNMQAMNKLTQVGQKYSASAHQIALSWLLHHSPNILLIPGTSKVKHLEENYKALEIQFSAED
jgi:aryl-alcohol dehydrogenase-like predicted oxidoreductase